MSFKTALSAEALLELVGECLPGAGFVLRTGREIHKLTLTPRIRGQKVDWQDYTRFSNDIDVWRLSLDACRAYETAGMLRVLEATDYSEDLAEACSTVHLIAVSGSPDQWCYLVKGWTLPQHTNPTEKLIDIPDPVMRRVGFSSYETAIVWGVPTYWFVRQGLLGYRRLIVPLFEGEHVVALLVAAEIEEPRGWNRLAASCRPLRRLVAGHKG